MGSVRAPNFSLLNRPFHYNHIVLETVQSWPGPPVLVSLNTYVTLQQCHCTSYNNFVLATMLSYLGPKILVCLIGHLTITPLGTDVARDPEPDWIG